jgi:hypothetical protein
MAIDIATPGADEAELEASLRALMTRTLSACKVYKAADQTTANYTGAGAQIAWTAEEYDSGGWHDNAVANTRLTVPSGVTRVDVEGKVEISLGTSSAYVLIAIQKNGSTVNARRYRTGSTDQVIPIFAVDVAVSAGDYLELYIQLSADTSVTIEGGVATNASFFKVKRVR